MVYIKKRTQTKTWIEHNFKLQICPLSSDHNFIDKSQWHRVCWWSVDFSHSFQVCVRITHSLNNFLCIFVGCYQEPIIRFQCISWFRSISLGAISLTILIIIIKIIVNIVWWDCNFLLLYMMVCLCPMNSHMQSEQQQRNLN